MTQAAAEIDRAALDGHDAFRRLVVEPCRPVVIRGAASDWPLAEAAKIDGDALTAYLARFDAGRQVEAFVGDAAISGRYDYNDDLSGFNFRRQAMALGEAVRRIAAGSDSETLYVGSLPIANALPGLAEDNRLPFAPPGVSPLIWIGHASTVPVSLRHDGQYRLRGGGTADLHPVSPRRDRRTVCRADRSHDGRPAGRPRRRSRARRPALSPFRAGARPAITVELGPGDALYMPKLWWHRVEATGAFNILVNYWWDAFPVGPDQPFPTMLLAMSAIAGRPPAERAAWRAGSTIMSSAPTATRSPICPRSVTAF